MSTKPTILLVDDTPENLQILVAALKDNYRLLIASSGEKALELAERSAAPDMILLDVMMPGIDGYQVCERLKQSGSTRDIPVIFVTALTEAGDEERGLELGAVDYFTKPISPSIVRARVKTHLALRRSMDDLQRAYRIIEAQKERMQKELDVGHQIQMSMLPTSFPQRPELEIFAALEPAREVGGDFYDCFFVDAHRLCFSIGDVSDKGVPSALLMAMTKTMIKSRAVSDASTARIVTHVNEELCSDNDSGMFVTLFAAILDLRTGELTSTNAGHNPPLIKHADGTVAWLSHRDGPVVGSLPGLPYGETSTRLNPGDILLLYTDGVTEADDGSDTLFSAMRLEQLLASSSARDMRSLVAEVRDAVVAFEAGAPRADDMTLLVLHLRSLSDAQVTDDFEVVIVNDKTQILTANEAFEEHAVRWGIPKRLRNQVRMAFDELLANVMEYGYDDQERHEIRITAKCKPDNLTLTLSDDGRPFDPLAETAPDLSSSAEERELGGLGIHLCRKTFDRIAYERRDERNVVTLEATLDTRPGPVS
jgi:sigma-B regulation protein RsbU (phosphoserine phosphatase)